LSKGAIEAFTNALKIYLFVNGKLECGHHIAGTAKNKSYKSIGPL
jgi:hypothetical protein